MRHRDGAIQPYSTSVIGPFSVVHHYELVIVFGVRHRGDAIRLEVGLQGGKDHGLLGLSCQDRIYLGLGSSRIQTHNFQHGSNNQEQ